MTQLATSIQPSNNIKAGQSTFKDKQKDVQVRTSNFTAGKAVADAIRTSLGPRGMDKMIQTDKGEIVITNDGATILKYMSVLHPAARMLVDLGHAQDVEAGDGTTSVVVLCGSLLNAAEKMLNKGIHPTQIAESFKKACKKCIEYLEEMSVPVDLADRSSLLKNATTSLNSKIVSQYSSLLAPMTVDAIMHVVNPATATNVDLKDIRLVKRVGGTLDDCELVPGLLLTQNVVKSAGGPSRVEKAKIGLIQFQLSPPKPDLENSVVVNDYRQMDKILKEERQYLLNICKKIKKAGCTVLLIQKSILRDAVNDLSLHFLSKLKILVVKEIERDEIEFICKSTGCKPIADIESFSEDKLGSAELVEEVNISGAKIVRVTGIKGNGVINTLTPSPDSHSNTSGVASTAASKENSIQNGLQRKTCSILIRGANQMVLEEAERSLHDALCVIRCLVKKRCLIAGGGAPEIEISQRLMKHSKTLKGMEQYCFHAFAEALEVVPTTLAENAGLNPIAIVTELRHRHSNGEKTAGINVRKLNVGDVLAENVVQPLLVTSSALELATQTVGMLLKIDDIVQTR